MTPGEAWVKASHEGPSNKTRKAVLSKPTIAYLYALYIDLQPKNSTRNAVLSDPECTCLYTKNIDKKHTTYILL